MTRYDEDFKIEVSKKHLSTRMERGRLRHNMDWIMGRYTAGQSGTVSAGLRKKFSHCSVRFKLSVLRRMWREELSYRRVSALFGLRVGHSVMTMWERLYYEGGLDALIPKPPNPLPPPSEEASTLEQLRI